MCDSETSLFFPSSLIKSPRYGIDFAGPWLKSEKGATGARVTFWCSAPVVTFRYTQCPAESPGLIQGVGEHSMMRDDV